MSAVLVGELIASVVAVTAGFSTERHADVRSVIDARGHRTLINVASNTRYP